VEVTMNNYPELFKTYPSVYAVRDRYVIIVAVNSPCTMWAKIGNEEFFDDSNGILRTASLTHKIEVPAALLNEKKEYTLYFRKVIERKPYFSELEEASSFTTTFRPLPEDEIRIFHIADAHNRIDGPVAAATKAGEHDLLILNGDIPNHSGDIKYFAAIHCIAGEITKGSYPAIFSRGNHDMRGIYAEQIADHTPTDNGRSYFSVNLGPIWALVLDCGEDKPDTNAEYGHTICCADFRKRQTDYINALINAPKKEYEADGVKFKLIISHIPFSLRYNPPFNIEEERYADWCSKIKENIKPELMLAGHIHNCKVFRKEDDDSHPCDVVSASRPIKGSDDIVCGSILLSQKRAVVRFVDSQGEILEENIIEFNK
jgi:hypothetical protein